MKINNKILTILILLFLSGCGTWVNLENDYTYRNYQYKDEQEVGVFFSDYSTYNPNGLTIVFIPINYYYDFYNYNYWYNYWRDYYHWRNDWRFGYDYPRHGHRPEPTHNSYEDNKPGKNHDAFGSRTFGPSTGIGDKPRQRNTNLGNTSTTQRSTTREGSRTLPKHESVDLKNSNNSKPVTTSVQKGFEEVPKSTTSRSKNREEK